MKIELQEWQTRYILEALRVCEAQWNKTAATCNDEDQAADIGNDVMRLTAAHDYLERVAVEAFGPGVNTFSIMKSLSPSPRTAVPIFARVKMWPT